MKRTGILFLIVLLSTSFTAFGQLKLKGNKEVTKENRDISDFTKIEVIDNVEVFLVYNENQEVVVETDSNLQQAVETEVSNGTLTIKTNAKILRKKELKIHIRVNADMDEIYGYNRAKISSKNSLAIDSLTINAFDNADFDIKLNSKLVRISGKKSSDIKVQALCDEAMFWTEEACNVKATIDTDYMNVNSLDRSSITMEGTCDIFEIESMGSSAFKGKSFVTQTAEVNATHSSDVYVNAVKAIDLQIKNSAEVYLYSDPKITLSEFFDKAAIYKRE